MASRRPTLSSSSLKLISDTAEVCREIDSSANPSPIQIDISKAEEELLAQDRRRSRRALIERRSARPSPGTSDLLHRPLGCETLVKGKMDVEVHDLVRLAPMHLLGGNVDKRTKR